MLKYFKTKKQMSKFRLKKSTHYKIEKGGKVIHNGIMTDELALEFLRINPEQRILLFGEYPENWKELLEGGAADKEEAQDMDDDNDSGEGCSECDRKKELMEINFNDLKKMYPDIPAPVGTKKIELVEAIIESERD